MATTSLWHIEGRLKDLIDYVENPDKTVARTQDLQNAFVNDKGRTHRLVSQKPISVSYKL